MSNLALYRNGINWLAHAHRGGLEEKERKEEKVDEVVTDKSSFIYLFFFLEILSFFCGKDLRKSTKGEQPLSPCTCTVCGFN